MIKKLLLLFINLITLYALNCSTVNAVKKYNGHYYTVTAKKMTFNAAKAFAEVNGGYLAIPNSSEENEFLRKLIPTPKYAWIGVYDPQYTSNYCYGGNCLYDDSRFRDIKGNALTYTNWAKEQPDNLVKDYDILNGKQLVSPLGEHWVAMSSLDGKWADFGNHADEHNNPVKFYALIEFEDMPECYEAPSNVTDTIEGAKCNTQIVDKSSGIIPDGGKIYNCLKDPKGVYYCPVGLAPCGEEWQYKNGTSKVICNGILKNGLCYEKVGNAKKKYKLSCKNMKVPCDPDADWCCHIDISCNGNSATIKYYDCCSPTGGLKNTTVISNINNFLNGVSYQPNNLGKIICDTSGACSIYFQNAYCKNYKPIGKPYLSNTFSLDTKEEYYCPDNQYMGQNVDLKADPLGCYRAYKPSYKYLCSGTNYYGEKYTPIVKTGDSPTPPPNNCKAKSFTCKPAPNRKCVKVDNKWQCSPYPCIGEGAGDYNITNEDTPVGVNDADNDAWNDDGSCGGNILIFNGRDMRCRNKDMLGNIGFLGGGCCNKDKTLGGIIPCEEQEKILARKNRNKQCHYIGEYCSKELDLFVGKICIQKKKTYCCFNSKLARIINEQGRPQLKKGWGSAKSPNCKGFTPEEFQKLDFSKMDLKEFYQDLNKNISNGVLNNMTNYIKNNINLQLQNVTPRSQP